MRSGTVRLMWMRLWSVIWVVNSIWMSGKKRAKNASLRKKLLICTPPVPS